MPKLSEVIRKALKISTFYYYDEQLDMWVSDFMFYMPRNDLIHAEEFNAVKHYKQKASAIRRAKEIAYKYSGEYLGRITDMEI